MDIADTSHTSCAEGVKLISEIQFWMIFGPNPRLTLLTYSYKLIICIHISIRRSAFTCIFKPLKSNQDKIWIGSVLIYM